MAAKSRWAMSVMALATALGVVACGPGTVSLRPAESCDGGNLDKCRERCDANDGASCYRLGWFHEEGENVREDIKRAMDLYAKACDQNYAIACRALGIIYWQGEEVKRDMKRAIAFYQRACDLGVPEACPTGEMIAESEGKRGSQWGDLSVSAGVQASGVSSDDAPQADTPDAPSVSTPDAPSAQPPSVGIP